MPGIDINEEIEEMLLYPQNAGTNRRGHEGIRETFCEVSPSASVKREISIFSLDQGLGDTLALEEEEEGEVGLARRVINVFTRVQNQPRLLHVLEAINSGTIEIQYARWQNYGGGEQFAAGPMLELAYYIPGGAAYDGLRDRSRGAGSPQDQWIGMFIAPSPPAPFCIVSSFADKSKRA